MSKVKRSVPGDERAVHVALKASVEARGDDAPRVLYDAFEVFNRACFEDKLGPPCILVSPPGSPRALGDYSPRDMHGLTSRIRIAPHVFARGLREAIGTLVHEMIHAWCSEVLGDLEKGYRGHGPKFASKANEISQQYGFPEVFPHGRGGLDASGWPYLVVAPDRPGPAKVRARKERLEDTGDSSVDPEGDHGVEADGVPEVEELRVQVEELRVQVEALSSSLELANQRAGEAEVKLESVLRELEGAKSSAARDKLRAKSAGLTGGNRRVVYAVSDAVVALCDSVSNLS